MLLKGTVKRFNICVVGVKNWEGVCSSLAYKKLLEVVFGLGKAGGQMRGSLAIIKMEDLCWALF